MRRMIIIVGISMIFFGSCSPQVSNSKTLQVPIKDVEAKPHVPVVKMDMTAVKLPTINTDSQKAIIGKRLFFDARLSGDGALSCASCHNPIKGFADGLMLSEAYPGSQGFRNTPTLINTALKKGQGIPWFHDGRMGTNLNDVIRDQITESIWMNMDMRIMQERVKQDPLYVQMFKDADLGEPSNGTVRMLISEYIKTLTSVNAPIDKGTLSESAKNGMEIFNGKGRCYICHRGPLFTDGEAHNVGVPENKEIYSNPNRHHMMIAFMMFMGIENYMNVRSDPGFHVVTHNSDGSDWGKFMTPTLRELKYTAPYMHNGMFSTLEDVIDFYNDGGGKSKNRDLRLKELDLSSGEKRDLKSFLLALSGDPLTGEKYISSEVIPKKYDAIKNWINIDN